MILNEQYTHAARRIEAAEHQRRVEQRQERDRLRKRSQRQNYIIGEMVCDYFPELRQIEPGTKEENKVRFALLTCVLKLMANSPDLISMLKNLVYELYGEQCDLFCMSTYTSGENKEEVHDGTQLGSHGEA